MSKKTILLWLEFFVIFAALPVVIKIYLHDLQRFFFPILILMSGYCLYFLLKDKSFDKAQLWLTSNWNNGMLLKTTLFLLTCILMILGVILFAPESFFGLMRKNPKIWLMVMFVYPLFSVTLQEVIYRAFFFQRYKLLFKSNTLLFLASVLVFAWAHFFFGNWLAIGLSGLGGLLFGITYLQTKSLLITCIEHSLYGCLIFTIGLGDYFYHGSQKVLNG